MHRQILTGLAEPLSHASGQLQSSYTIAAVLIGIGVLHSVLMFLFNRSQQKPTRFEYPEDLHDRGPLN